MRKLLWGFAVALTASIVILACQKEDSKETTSKDFSVAAAKEWWYGEFRKSPAYSQRNTGSIFATPTGYSNKKYPDWNKAISYKKSGFEMVEMPLFYHTKRIMLPGMQDLYKTKEGERIGWASISKLLITKKPDGSTIVRTVTIIPSPTYAMKNNYDISHVYPNNLPSDFDGYLMIAGWDESEKNIVKVEKGKKGKKIRIVNEEEKKSYLVKQRSNNRIICPPPQWVPNMVFVCNFVPTGDAAADEDRCQEIGT